MTRTQARPGGTMGRRTGLVATLAAAALLAVSCGSDEAPTPAADQPHPAEEAVATWLDHLASDDDRAFTDLAPRSQAAIGDLANYRRGSSRFAPTYERFAAGDVGDALPVADGLVVVTLRVEQPAEVVAAVPVRRVGDAWQVDPILDVGSYSVRPDDGADVGPRPEVVAQLDDPGTTAVAWFDGDRAEGDGATFRPADDLAPGWHIVTLALVRGDDIVARAFRVRVDG
jgi:hypothetical protein